MKPILLRLIVVLPFLLLASCMVPPANLSEVKIDNPHRAPVPINGILVVDLSAQERAGVYVHQRTLLPWERTTFPSGQLMEKAALRAFGLVYAQTATSLNATGLPQPSANANPLLPQLRLIARITSQPITGSTGAVSTTYRATVNVSLVKQDGSPVGTFTGNGDGESFNIKDSAPYENAYFNAFVDVINQMMRDPAVVAKL